MHRLDIETIKRGKITLSFQKFSNFVWIVGNQIGILKGYIDDTEDYCLQVSRDLTKRWQAIEKLKVFDKLNSDSIVVDIGSGAGLLDLILYKYLNGGKFILVDKSEVGRNHVNGHWNINHGFYNDWAVFEDLSTNSDIDIANFELISPEINWPNKIDLIMSTHSYLWHYPKEVYWDRIKPYALQNTSLCFDILNRKNNNVINEISNEINKTPICYDKPFPAFHWFENELYNVNNSFGKLCFWD